MEKPAFKSECFFLQLLNKAFFNDCQVMRVTSLEVCVLLLMASMLRSSLRCKQTLFALEIILKNLRMREPNTNDFMKV